MVEALRIQKSPVASELTLSVVGKLIENTRSTLCDDSIVSSIIVRSWEQF